MVQYEAGTPGSVWYQLASLSFILAGLFSDLLLIRIFLSLGYFWFVVNALAGWPLWPAVVTPDPKVLAVDALVWSLIGIYLHGSSLARLVLDERPVPLDSEEEEALFNMFMRRSGFVSKLVFSKSMLPYGRFQNFQPGEQITTSRVPPPDVGVPVVPAAKDAGTRAPMMHIVMTGHVKATIANDDVRIAPGDISVVSPQGDTNTITTLNFFSGDLFEFKNLNLLGVHVRFERCIMTSVAVTPVRTWSIPVAKLKEIINASPSLKQAWFAIFISAVAHAADEVDDPCRAESASGLMDPERAGQRSAIFEPLKPHEKPASTTPGSGSCLANAFSGLGELLANSFSPPWPLQAPVYGLRHSPGNPLTGLAAANFVEQQLRHQNQESYLEAEAAKEAREQEHLLPPGGSQAPTPYGATPLRDEAGLQAMSGSSSSTSAAGVTPGSQVALTLT